MKHKVKVVYSIQGTTCTDILESESDENPSIQIQFDGQTAIVVMGDSHAVVYSQAWKVERISE